MNALSGADITFGIYDKDLQLSINPIILLGKQIIYQCCNLSLKPSLTVIEKVKYTNKY